KGYNEKLRKNWINLRERIPSLILRLEKRLDSAEHVHNTGSSWQNGHPQQTSEDCLDKDVVELINSIDLVGKHKQCADSLKELGESIRRECMCYSNLLDVAQEYLHSVQLAFHEHAGESNGRSSTYNPWRLNADTGWYTYLCATALSEVDDNGHYFSTPKLDSNCLDHFLKHPDAPGFVIDQREARASFDDWRFMKYDLTRKLNLASIRSHDA